MSQCLGTTLQNKKCGPAETLSTPFVGGRGLDRLSMRDQLIQYSQ